MSVRERMMICRVVEQIERNKNLSRKLGVENASTFRGKPVCVPVDLKRRE